MASKKETLRTEMDNDRKIQAEMNESNENLAHSLKEIENEIASIEKMRAPETVEDPDLSSPVLKELENSKKRLLQQFFQLNFFFRDPHPGFDRSTVKGKVFMLFRTNERSTRRPSRSEQLGSCSTSWSRTNWSPNS